MNETVNQENKTAEQPEHTFTQEEMNAIIRDRFSREREKYADYETLRDKAQKFDAAEEASKSELQKAQERAETLQAQLNALTHEAEIQKARTKVATEKGIPANLLTGSTEEECTAQADAILAFAKVPGFNRYTGIISDTRIRICFTILAIAFVAMGIVGIVDNKR